MKRLLTYGLLLLTILASHFVVSACQDDLPENTEVMVTFTTRATPGADDSDSPILEQMHDLSVIMLRSNGTIVGKHSYKPEPGQKNPSSIIFSFSTTIPNPSGENFTFLAIANEDSIAETLPWENLSVGQTLSANTIKALKVNTDINSKPMPQTDYWTVHVPQTQNHQVNDTLDFVGSKISVVFNNQTEEPQSLSDIRITGITPNTQGYLFKQDGTDYIDSKLTDNGNAVSTISFGDLTLAAPTTASDSVAYYTYPLGEGNISSPMLYATWGDETEPRTLDLSSITSLKRNEHLRIEITLTPAGDITVNYTIAPWEENKTNIGGEAPTIPGNTPGNGYNTEDWTAGNDIEIGGGGGNNAGPDFIPEGTTVVEGFWGEGYQGLQLSSDWNNLHTSQNFPVDSIKRGDILAIKFKSASWINEEYEVKLSFVAGNQNKESPALTGWHNYTISPNLDGVIYFTYQDYYDEEKGIDTKFEDFIDNGLIIRVVGVTNSNYNHVHVVGLVLTRPSQ